MIKSITKNGLIFILLVILFLFNEFFLVYFQNDAEISSYTLKKIRYVDLLLIFLIIIVYYYWNRFFELKLYLKILIILSLIFIIDIGSGFFNFGYSYKSFDESNEVYRHPYDEFRGKPNVLDHNKYGFRGLDLDKTKKNKKLKIAFFGGSTGYHGEPPIPEIINQELNKKLPTDVYNFSSIASNHNQHLMRLVQFSDFEFDIIVFYGGYNETQQHYYYDPRPGYPLSFYTYQIPTFNKFLIKYSKILGEIDFNFGIFSGYKILVKKYRDNDLDVWIDNIAKNYFSTLKKAKKISINVIEPSICKKTSFLGIYQPSQSIELATDKIINKIQSDIIMYDFLIDYSNLKNFVKFKDIIHIEQESKYLIAKRMLEDIYPIIENCIKK